MKIIFLDIDGVLNSMDFYEAPGHSLSAGLLNPATIKRLKKLVDLSGARLVLSSSWREGWSKNPEELQEDGRMLDRQLAESGLVLMDKTGTVGYGSKSHVFPGKITDFGDGRCEEILLWLAEHGMRKKLFCKADRPLAKARRIKGAEPVEAFVILDDADYSWKEYGLDANLVQTDFEDGGLLDCHVDAALQILNNSDSPITK